MEHALTCICCAEELIQLADVLVGDDVKGDAENAELDPLLRVRACILMKDYKTATDVGLDALK